MLDPTVVDSLFPEDLHSPAYWEQRYPPRNLPPEAKVTRFCPSPTGFLHVGGVYVAVIDVDIAAHSGGTYLVRIEDTDQARVVPGAVEQFASAFSYFSIGSQDSGYGPYTQSLRSEVYLSYVRQLLYEGKAYLCFASRRELEEITAQQRAAGVPAGYYGRWATWRDAPGEKVMRHLETGDPYVVRFRSPGLSDARVRFTDASRGEIEHDDNRNDAVILKSSGQEPRLPTYHFAHAVDDHLMRVNLVIRGDEWISSVPLHRQLFDALGFEPVEYAHIAPLMKQEGRSRRKLSKRKDPEASVSFYLDEGYPAEAVRYYLRGLANGRLAELPLRESLAAPIRLAECGAAGPLVDLVKLDDISADFIATLTGREILDRVAAWAADRDLELAHLLAAEKPLALRALAIERENVPNPRKDLIKWSDFRPVYGYFFPQLFTPATSPSDPRFGRLDPQLVQALAADFAGSYQAGAQDDDWFGQIRQLAARHGFAPNQKTYKQDPSAYPGSIRESSQVIRVLLTGTTRSPNLTAVAHALGPREVIRRATTLR